MFEFVRSPQSWLKLPGEPLRNKPVTSLAGIGEDIGRRLVANGFDKAYVVLGQFLILKKNKGLFFDWIKDTAGANNKQANGNIDSLLYILW